MISKTKLINNSTKSSYKLINNNNKNLNNRLKNNNKFIRNKKISKLVGNSSNILINSSNKTIINKRNNNNQNQSSSSNGKNDNKFKLNKSISRLGIRSNNKASDNNENSSSNNTHIRVNNAMSMHLKSNKNMSILGMPLRLNKAMSMLGMHLKSHENMSMPGMPLRLNKAMSILGICSRRDADKYIANKSVYVNNKLVEKLGTKVKNGDIITVNGINYTFTNKHKTRVWIYNKPSGLVTTHKDEKGRPTVFDNISDIIGQRVISVGRLDLNSEGLLLLTNNGSFARYAESPNTGWERHYRVRFFGNINNDIINKISSGITIDNIHYAPIKITNISNNKGLNKWCTCILKEGKNREIRKIFNYFGLQVNKLIRIKYGPYELGSLKIGEVKEVEERRK